MNEIQSLALLIADLNIQVRALQDENEKLRQQTQPVTPAE